MLMLNMPEVVLKAINDVNERLEKQKVKSAERAWAIYNAYEKLKENGVEGIPAELSEGQCQYGFSVDVKEPSQWGKIHKSVGKLSVSDKQPVMEADTGKRGAKMQKVRLVLSPEGELNWLLQFRTERKLTKKDKCKVKTVTNKSIQVVCNLG